MADVINDVKNIGATFTSWDSCMSKAYCKWPVIAAIILGSIIVLSILWCIFSCLCCGVSLFTACGKCLTCGGCCGACSRGGGRKRNDPEYHPMPPTPVPYQGYQPPAMMYNNTGPQFATFDAGSKRGGNVHEDSLPAMPSWDNAHTRRVEDQTLQQRGSDMEMEHMLPQHGPASPVRENPYGSDLGAQRMNGHNADYYDTPLSPAPTYYSTAPATGGALAPTHRQLSPQQHQYDSSPYDRHTSPSVAPYPSSRESTQFTSQNYNFYQQPSHGQVQDTRPPSLLHVGRKPVAGSYREV